MTCTSAGRLFDAWAALLGLPGRISYEGEAALRLEDMADVNEPSELSVKLAAEPGPFYRLDWRPWVAETRNLLQSGVSAATVAARFHNALSAWLPGSRACRGLCECGVERRLFSKPAPGRTSRGIAHRRALSRSDPPSRATR